MVAKGLIFALTLGFGIAAGYWLVRPQPSQTERDRRVQARIADLEQRVHDLEDAKRLDAIGQSYLAATRAAQPPAHLEATAPSALPLTRAAEAPAIDERDVSPESTHTRAEAFLASLDDAVETPARDARWNIATTSAARTSIASALVGSRIVEEKCGSDTCRIVVEHAADDAEHPVERGLYQMPPFDQGCSVAYTPSDANHPARSRIYVRRVDKVAAAR